MPNLLFIGFSEVDAEQIIGSLFLLLPYDMEEAVYKAYPDGAPVYAKGKKPAPYIIIRDSDQARAERFKDALQDQVDYLDGPPDVEIDIIQFCPGSGEVHEESYQ